jgi:hypothetical protein
MFPLFQVLLTAVLLTYAGYWRSRHSKRRAESWDQIVVRLRPNDWGYEDVTQRYLYSDQINATAEDIWQRISGAKGLWAMYHNCQAMVQLADYAAEHSQDRIVPEELLEQIRSDAFHIRMCVLVSLAQHVFRPTSIAAAVSAHRATATYTSMIARTTAVFQDYSTILFPKFLDAM